MAFEKTQEQLDTLRNLTWQNGKLLEQIEKLTKMLEEKEDSALVVEIEEAKKVLADAINTKGGSASADESFQQLAEDVLAMPTSGIFANGVVQTEPFSFLNYITSNEDYKIESINSKNITTISRDFCFSRHLNLKKIEFETLSSIIGVKSFFHCISLKDILMPELYSINGDDSFSYCLSLRTIYLPKLEIINAKYTFQNCSSLENVILPALTTISTDSRLTFNRCDNLKNIMMGKLINIYDPFSQVKPNLRNITIGVGTNINLPFQLWTATNVIAEGQSGIDELNANLYNNLLTKLADHSEDGQTRTLHLGWLAHVSQENIDYANSKGWTLTK